mgnify:CR=1 FL=1
MNAVTQQDWEYVVRDYLEIACSLKEPEQDFLLKFLKQKGLKADAIHIHPAFSIDDCLVVIVEGHGAKEKWFYHPGQQTIRE